jgi:hypothetical protein
MMAIFGWICLVVMMLAVTASWLVMWFNHGGRWTIGGAENSALARIIINFIGAGIFVAWYLVFADAPFTLVLE